MNREALVVGINRYPFMDDRDLRRGAADAVAIAKMLQEHGGFRVYLSLFTKINGDGSLQVDSDLLSDGSLPADSDLLSDIIPNRKNLEEAIGRLFNPPSEIPGEGNDTALLYFAGHGLVKEAGGDREIFLATSDANGKDRWGVSLNWLRQELLKSKVPQKLVWLDCCYSGELLNFEEADLGKLGPDKDTCLIAASRSFEAAEELVAEHGLLTRALLEGLDPNKHEEPLVTNESLTYYIKEKLRTTDQRPVCKNQGNDIFITGEKKALSQAIRKAGICPYKGLEPFGFNEEDPKYFYGRTALVDEMLDRLGEGNFLAVVGASGSGKSSAVQAGLLPKLKPGQQLSGSNERKIVIFRPGKHPLKSLVRAFDRPPEQFDFRDGLNLAQLVRDTGAQSVVLVADQFEEAFTLCQDLKLRERFFACLLGALDKPNTNLRVIITMRSDFLDKCAEGEYSGLVQKIQDNQVNVAQMSPDELEEAIEKPAWKAGLGLERNLVEQMLSDVEGPGSLPLLQYTLRELWEKRRVDRLTGAEYRKLGTVKGALEKRAEEVYKSLEEKQQLAAMRIFLELTQLGEGTEDTRRQILKKDLFKDRLLEAVIDVTVNKLADARLLVTSELQRPGEGEKTVIAVDVAHESLIKNWKRLRGWVDDNREAMRIGRRIDSEASEWSRNGKLQKDLLKGTKLINAKYYREKYDDSGMLSDLGNNFIDESINGESRARNQKVRLVFLFGSLVLILAISSIYFALETQKSNIELKKQNEETEKQKKIADIRADAASVKNLLNIKPVNALILAIKTTGSNLEIINSSGEEEIEHEVQSSLRDAVFKVRETNRFQAHTGVVNSIAFSQDRKYIVTGSHDKTVCLWDIDGNPIRDCFEGHQNAVNAVAFSPDGKYIVSGSYDNTLRLWNLHGNTITKFEGHESLVNSVAFSQDGKYIVSGSYDDNNKSLRLWDLQGNTIREFRSQDIDIDIVYSVAFSPDDKYIACGSGNNLLLWDLQENRIRKIEGEGHDKIVYSVAFSPDSKYIVSGSFDNTLRLWDIEGNKEVKVLRGHDNYVSSVAFSPDGRYIVSGSYDKTVRLWDAKGNFISELFINRESYVRAVAFSPDSKYVISSHYDKTLRLWDIENQLGLWNIKINLIEESSLRRESDVNAVAFSQDGNYIVTGSYNNTLQLWLWDDIEGKPIDNPFRGHKDSVSSVSFSQDGKYIVSGSDDNHLHLWEINGNLIKEFQGHESDVNAVAFSPNGKYIVSGSDDDTLRLWDIKENSSKRDYFQGHESDVNAVAFSQDGKYIVSGSDDNTLRLWDIEGSKEAKVLRGHESSVSSVAFSPDSKYIVSGSYDNTLRLWDIKGSKDTKVLRGHESSVISVAFSPDSKYIVSGSSDRTLRLWDIEGNPIGEPFRGHESVINSVAFSPDGKHIVSGGRDQTLRLWSGGNWQDWLKVACNRLLLHPALAGPETQKETQEETQGAIETCQNYVWEKNDKDKFLSRQEQLLTQEQLPTPKYPNTQINNVYLDRIIEILPDYLVASAIESIPVILQECEENGVTEKEEIAYILATAEAESDLGIFMKELTDGSHYEGRSDLGNTQLGDGPRYKGRGFVQITGRLNYLNWNNRLRILMNNPEIDLVKNPERAAEPQIAAKILVIGMRDGLFTSKKLSDYINSNKRDFYNARRIVNHLDRAAEIEKMAKDYYEVLR